MSNARAWIVVTVFALLAACRSSEPQGDARLQGSADTRSEEAVRLRLEEVVELFTASFADITDQIRHETSDPALQRRMIVAKTRIVPSARAVLQKDNPLDGLIDLWVMSLQFRNLFRSDAGQRELGEHCEQVVAVATRVANAIEREIESFVGGENYDLAVSAAEKFAEENPLSMEMTRRGLLPSEQPSAQSSGLFSWVPTINLIPFGGVGEGISEGAAAIQAFAKVANRFTTVVNGIPDRISWELELFQHDFAYNPAIVDTNRSIATIAASVDRIATTAETLPADVREQVSLAMADLDPKLEEIRATLADAEATAAGLERTGMAFEATAKAMEPMAAQLDVTVKTFHALMRYLNGEVDADGNKFPPPDPTAEKGPGAHPFNVLEFDQTARSLTLMAAELSTAVSGFRELVSDPVIPQRVDEVGETAQTSIRAAIWDATIGALVVLVAFFVLLFAYRRLAR